MRLWDVLLNRDSIAMRTRRDGAKIRVAFASLSAGQARVSVRYSYDGSEWHPDNLAEEDWQASDWKAWAPPQPGLPFKRAA